MDASVGLLVIAAVALASGAAGWLLRGRRLSEVADKPPEEPVLIESAAPPVSSASPPLPFDSLSPEPPATESPDSERPGTLTQAILDAAVDGIVIIGETGVIRSINTAAERIFGYPAEEVVGRNVSMLMPEPYRSAHDGYLAHYRETGEARIIGKGREVQGLRKNGHVFPMDLAVGGAVVDGERLFAGIVRDISIRRETEERLRYSEAKNRAILEAAVDGIITIDDRGRIESFNRAAERIFGYSAAEVLGRNVSMLMPAPYRQAHDGYLENYLNTSQPRIIGIGREVEGRRKDGETFPMDLAVGEGFLAGRRIFAGTVRDITERKRADADLRTAKDEAERASVAKTKFLAAASHDLRQPVQSLVFFTAALTSQLPDGTARAMVDDMEVAVAALKTLLDSLLDISKLDAGVVTVRPMIFPVDSVLATTRVSYTTLAAAKGVRLTVVPSNALVRTDPALFGRMVQNLVDNAVRYTGKGRIVVGCRRRGDLLRVEVWDTGIGIPAGHIEEIFEEFTQIGNPERDREKGLGLGLAIVKRLSRLLGHRVSVRSVHGRGSVFWVEVPLQATVRLRPATQRSAVVAGDGAGRGVIVLIDDEPVVLSSLRAVLESWGFEVVAAESAHEAIRLLAARERPPAVILADYRLREGRTGTEAIRDVCDLYRRAIPSIIITGDTAPERIREAEASGISVLHKPVTPPVLLSALTQTMGNA
ncbi:PAS domain-containing hybrid sensor histidine kinase/response regulator [Azospirillum canadense]|uniref:PAS domain-containing hybrid sensor histidine kinase/response regulator n=1 Tax=Azospirillum canadense TaxID=403962 RepID=UPI002226E306|nr:PAS domain S-box protein [Azospirillum canadense]MCW2238038.1 PAS domain S-box-containing protein [Azospirillum canadense]